MINWCWGSCFYWNEPFSVPDLKDFSDQFQISEMIGIFQQEVQIEAGKKLSLFSVLTDSLPLKYWLIIFISSYILFKEATVSARSNDIYI